MNLLRARELYSQYREGSLDEHAREALERAFRESPAMSEDYRRFEEVLQAYEAQKDDPVPEPYLLHERIVSRLDKAVLDSKRSQAPIFSGWRTAMIGALGATAIVAAVLSINRGGTSSTAQIVPAPVQSQLTWAAEGKGVRIFHTPGKGSLQVFADDAAIPAYEAPLGQSKIEIPLVNRDVRSHVYRIVTPEKTIHIALPGTSSETPDSGSGSVEELAAAVAARFQSPVEVQYSELGEPAEWEFKGKGPVQVKVSGAPVSVQELANGKLAIN
ncbi:MAG: hypothetical protein IT207_04345 [Fimbriimonadaceae bacterium]|nr:hypothetical protein [Fimbriimonadaceae bacterium]